MLKKLRIVLLIVVTIVTLTSTAVTATTYESSIKIIEVFDFGLIKTYVTKVETIDEFFTEQGIKYKDYDEIYIKSADGTLEKEVKQSNLKYEQLTENEFITVLRARPVNLNIDGERSQVMTCRDTVKEFLKENDIVIYDKDVIDATMSTPINSNMYITIKTYKEETITETEELEFSIEKKETEELPLGEERVIQEGQLGEKVLTYKITLLGEEEIDRELLSEEIKLEPSNTIIEVGTYVEPEPEPEPIPEPPKTNYVNTGIGNRAYKEVRVMEATAYTPYEGSSLGLTATGMKARYGVVAVDPKVIPLHTKLYIEGYGEAIAADTGGSIKGNKIDLCFESHQQMINFGRRKVTVYILE